MMLSIHSFELKISFPDPFFFILDAREYVVKAQIHAGGRGKGVFLHGFHGGVHLVKK